MSEILWTYDPRTHNYRRNGSFVSFAEVKEISLKVAENSGNTVESLAWQLINGQLRLDHWQELMRSAIKNEHLAQYMAGKGGVGQMTQRDYGILGWTLREQYRFLDGFASDIASGNMTPAQIINRARMYIEDAHQSFWRGRTEAMGMPALPTYPSHCDTECLTKCRCEWIIEEIFDESGARIGWNATWRLDPGAAEVHCHDCPSLATLWNPLFVPAGMTPRQAEVWRNSERDKMLDIISEADDMETLPPGLYLGGPGSGNWGHIGEGLPQIEDDIETLAMAIPEKPKENGSEDK